MQDTARARGRAPADLMPRVSVVIPSYNAGGYLAEAVASVLAQTLRDLDVVVVDDGSTDGSVDALREAFDDRRLRLVRQPNAGVSAARNRGLSDTTGKLVAFLDADDLFEPSNLERKADYLADHPDVALVHSHRTDFGEAGPDRIVSAEECQGWVRPLLLAFVTSVNSPTSALIRRSALERCGGFDPEFGTSADLDLWVRLAGLARFGYIPEPLTRYRLHTAQMHRELPRFARETRALLRKADQEGWFQDARHRARCWFRGERTLSASYFHHSRRMDRVLAHGVRAVGWAARLGLSRDAREPGQRRSEPR